MKGTSKSKSGTGGPPPAKRPATAPAKVSARLPVLVVAHTAVAERAYQLWLDRAGQPGDDVGDWLEAERQLLAESGPKVPRGRGKAVS